jgi:tRNA nucleotidyltransferase (CCA-adding enzyme)
MGTAPLATGAKVLEGLRALPGGAALLALAQGREDVDLVGGAVRDLLLGSRPHELDVVVARDAVPLAQALATELRAQVTVHERFGTALVEGEQARVDVVTRRAETYPAAGALPQVRAGTPQEDLLRRDFTVNAIAVGLGGARKGELRHAPHALEDLREGRLRVLHQRSFLEDPTRLLRLARYRTRLGFDVEAHTDRLAHEAVAAGALASVSGARVGAELRLALTDVHPITTLAFLDERGVLSALHPDLRFDEHLAAGALELLPDDGRLDILLLATAAQRLIAGGEGGSDREGSEPDARERPSAAADGAESVCGERSGGAGSSELARLLDRFEFPRADRDRAVAAAVWAARLAEELTACRSASELYFLAEQAPIEGVALAGALGGTGDGGSGAAPLARRWLGELRHVRLRINGEDLLAAGVPQGPEVGRRLHQTLALRLDGQLAPGREAELAAALGYGERR